MPQILTFLGQPRQYCAVASMAMARHLAYQGAKVLWITQDSGSLADALIGQPVSPEVQSVAPNLSAVQLKATVLLEKSWDIVKNLEAQYLRNPFLKQVFGQEMVVLPGMDEALTLNAIRELYEAGAYDYLVFDGQSSAATLRMWALPENLDWYIRRFQKVVMASEIAQTLAPFVQPLASTLLNISGSPESLNQPLQQAQSLLDTGRSAVQSRQQVLGFLVTSEDPTNIAMVRQLWGSSQQIGLTVGGTFVFPQGASLPETSFSPLSIYELPVLQGDNWDALMATLPSLTSVMAEAPAPVEIDEAAKQVRLFLPGYSKGDVALTQYGPEVTLTAGDQRRNLFLPDTLKGLPIQGAKFQDSYLILSF